MEKSISEFRINSKVKCCIHKLIALTFLISCSAQAADKQELVFTTLDGTYVQKISELVIREAYSRLNISIQIKELPARRAIAMANSGLVDGELSRVSGIEKKFTSLIPINVPVNFIEGVILSKDKPVTVDGWDSIKKFKVAIRRGVVFAERGTRNMDVQVLNTWDATLSALQTGRADVLVVPKTIALQILHNYEPKNIIINEPAVVSLPLYHYLNTKRSAMAPKIESVLNKMQSEGTIKSIIDNARKKMTYQ